MKPLRISEDIMSLSDFKNHASKVLSRIHTDEEMDDVLDEAFLG